MLAVAYCLPTIDFLNNGGLRHGISIDDEVPQVSNIYTDKSNRAWEKSVADTSLSPPPVIT
jgi:hypothetical protein